MPALYRKSLTGTPFGNVHLVWSEARGKPSIVRIFLPGTREWMPAGSAPGSCDMVMRVSGGIEDLLSGRAATFSLDDLAMDECTPFQRAVLESEFAVPRGRVTTYGLLARKTGRPGAARAAGSALARNPFPLVIPCHRAVRSDGNPGGYQGGADMKRRLLEMEGVAFDVRGRVAADRFWFGAQEGSQPSPSAT
jgi:methylated-DNA-[protein]-cysteine S-methyltransferase